MKKRKMLQVQISSELYDAMKEIATYENSSVAQVSREMLEALEPGVFQALDMMRAARTMNEKARKALIPVMARHGKHLEDSVKYGLENIEAALNGAKTDPPQHNLPL